MLRERSCLTGKIGVVEVGEDAEVVRSDEQEVLITDGLTTLARSGIAPYVILNFRICFCKRYSSASV